jgi:putative oxidoreductase
VLRAHWRNRVAMDRLLMLVRMALGLLLIATGALKIGHGPELAAAVAAFRLLPQAVIPALALILPYFEVLLGLYLLAGLFTRAAAIVAAVLLVVYAGAIASAVIRHIPANCGCFGPYDQAKADWPHVAFDVALACIAALLAAGGSGSFSLDRRLQKE